MNNRRYSHVIVVGIDGAGSFFQNTPTPNFDKIFENGAITYDALASNPSISAECWGSMILGVGPEVHKLTNSIVSNCEYPKDSAFPSLFKRINEVFPDAKLGSYCDWNPITAGIIERDIKISTATAKDDLLAPVICDYIKAEKPDFLFIQFDSVDGAGHKNGYGTPGHLERLTHVDSLIGDVFNAACDADIIDDTLFIVISDHGGTNPGTGGGSHGGWTDGEKYVTLAIRGNNVQRNRIPAANVRDLAAIVLYAFGIDAPEFDESGWTSQIPEKIFSDSTLPAYKDISHLAGAAPRISKIPHTSEAL